MAERHLARAMTDVELWVVIALFSFFVGYPVAKGFMEGVGSMSNKWVAISAEDARKHKLYGIGGWLILLIIGTIFGALASLGSVKGAMFDAGVDWADLGRISKNFEIFIYAVLSIQFASSAVVLWLIVAKAEEFRKISTIALLLGFPLAAAFAIVYPNAGSGAFLAYGGIDWIVRCLIWVPYFQMSKRVRVTFEHKVRNDDAHLQSLILDSIGSASSTNGGQRSEVFEKYAISNAANSSTDSVTKVSEVQASSNNELDVWEAALNEYEGANRDRGLYAKLFVEYDGDENKVKTAYLKRRAQKISQEQSAAEAKERSIEMASFAKAVNAAIDSGSLTEVEVGGRKCLRFIDGYLGFLSLNKYYVFNDVDALRLQLDAIDKDISHKVNGAIIVRPLEATTDEVCLKEKRYSQARIGGINYYLLNNGRVVYFSTGKFYAFEDLGLLRNAVQKGDHHKLADSIYGMNFG